MNGGIKKRTPLEAQGTSLGYVQGFCGLRLGSMLSYSLVASICCFLKKIDNNTNDNNIILIIILIIMMIIMIMILILIMMTIIIMIIYLLNQYAYIPIHPIPSQSIPIHHIPS